MMNYSLFARWKFLMLFVIIAICLIVLVAIYACLCMSPHDD